MSLTEHDRDRSHAQSVRAWDAALDDMEARLAHGWSALAKGDFEVTPFSPPSGLGPLPFELREKAGRVLEETQAFETALRDRSDAIAHQLVTLHRRPEEPRASARYFDQAL